MANTMTHAAISDKQNAISYQFSFTTAKDAILSFGSSVAIITEKLWMAFHDIFVRV